MYFKNIALMPRNLLKISLGLFLFVSLAFSSCQKESKKEFSQKVNSKGEAILSAQKEAKQLIQKHQIVSVTEAVENNPKVLSLLKTNSNSRSGAMVLQIAENEHLRHRTEMVKTVINPDDFECGPTFLGSYLNARTANFTANDFFFINQFGIIAFFEGILFDDDSDVDYFGVSGDFTSQMRKTFINLKTFWDIPTDIQLSDAHGTIFKNPAVVSEIIQLLFVSFDENGNPQPVSADAANELAGLLQVVFSAGVFEDYNHPLFTFNALALDGIPGLGIGKKIVMGDGILEAYAELGFRTMADRFILAHEYAHQIQFANGYFEDGPPSPEGTRRTELMADAYASYFMSHRKGPFLRPLMVKRFIKTSFSIGDCGFFSTGHHGTPNQRAKAAAFGGNLAQRRGFLDPAYSSQEFFELFEEALPAMVAPDAGR